jgi:multiple sugar transport system substrate-binding protein
MRIRGVDWVDRDIEHKRVKNMSARPSLENRRGQQTGSSRRRFLVGSGLAAGLAALERRRPAAADWVLPSEAVSVTFWDSTSAPKTRLYNERIIPSYRQRRPIYTVRYENIATGNLLQRLVTAAASGTAPEIFELGDWLFPTYFGRDLLDSVPAQAFGFPSLKELLDSYLPGSLSAMQHEGKLFGLPDYMASHSLHINNRLFREAGLDPVRDAPKTWDEVARLNGILTRRKDGQIVQKGFEFRYVDERSLTLTFHHLLYQAGGDVLDKEGRPAFNSDAGVKALEVWRSVTVAPRVTRNTGASPFLDFGSEQDAMAYIGPNGQAQAVNINPRMKDNVTVTPLPQINPARPATATFSFVIVVNAKVPADRRRVAWDFVAHALGDPRPWLGNGVLLPQKAWATSAEARQLLPFYDVFVHDISIGRPLARTRNFAELQGALGRMIERVIFGKADPKAALDQAAVEFERAVKG